jgi:hypothetical protein
MNQYSILKMARESGLLRGGDGWTMPHRWGITEIERFAALIEQHLSYDSIHTCHAECQRPACVAVREAVKAEREQIKQSIRHSLGVGTKTIQSRVYFGSEEVSMVKMPIAEVSAAIRARGEK